MTDTTDMDEFLGKKRPPRVAALRQVDRHRGRRGPRAVPAVPMLQGPGADPLRHGHDRPRRPHGDHHRDGQPCAHQAGERGLGSLRADREGLRHQQRPGHQGPAPGAARSVPPARRPAAEPGLPAGGASHGDAGRRDGGADPRQPLPAGERLQTVRRQGALADRTLHRPRRSRPRPRQRGPGQGAGGAGARAGLHQPDQPLQGHDLRPRHRCGALAAGGAPARLWPPPSTWRRSSPSPRTSPT